MWVKNTAIKISKSETKNQEGDNDSAGKVGHPKSREKQNKAAQINSFTFFMPPPEWLSWVAHWVNL